jgi:hypothetical protein
MYSMNSIPLAYYIGISFTRSARYNKLITGISFSSFPHSGEWLKLINCHFSFQSVDLAQGIDRSTVEDTSGRLVKATSHGTNLVSGDLLKTVDIIENFVKAEEIRDSGTDLTEVVSIHLYPCEQTAVGDRTRCLHSI